MAAVKYFLVMNPTARSGAARRSCERIISELQARKADFDYQMTRRKDEAIDIARQASQRNHQVIVAVGGDGTICEVITGMLRESQDGGKKLGVLHIGTSPDFNRYCDIPVKLDDAIQTLLAGKTRRIDAGKVVFQGLNDQPQTFYFGSSVNIGLGPHIASKANSRYRKYCGDFLGTLLSSLVAVSNFKGVTINVSVDGRESDYGKLINLTVGKDPYLASGMRIFNDVKADDGRLFLFSLEKAALFPLLCHVPQLYVGNFFEYEHARIDYGYRVEVTSDEEVFLEFDGDMRGKLPATIEVVVKGLEVITA